MSEFKKGDILVNKTAVNTGAIELIYEHKYYFHGFDCEVLDKPENHISPNCEVKNG